MILVQFYKSWKIELDDNTLYNQTLLWKCANNMDHTAAAWIMCMRTAQDRTFYSQKAPTCCPRDWATWCQRCVLTCILWLKPRVSCSLSRTWMENMQFLCRCFLTKIIYWKCDYLKTKRPIPMSYGQPLEKILDNTNSNTKAICESYGG